VGPSAAPPVELRFQLPAQGDRFGDLRIELAQGIGALPPEFDEWKNDDSP